MKFDADKFLKNLKPYEKKENSMEIDNKGVATVIRHVWLHSPTAEVDFDSFTLEDVESVAEEMEQLPIEFDDGGEMFICDPENLFVVMDHLVDVSYKFTNAKNKLYELDEDDLFI